MAPLGLLGLEALRVKLVGLVLWDTLVGLVLWDTLVLKETLVIKVYKVKLVGLVLWDTQVLLPHRHSFTETEFLTR